MISVMGYGFQGQDQGRADGEVVYAQMLELAEDLKSRGLRPCVRHSGE